MYYNKLRQQQEEAVMPPVPSNRFIPFDPDIPLQKPPGWRWYPKLNMFADPHFAQAIHVILERDGVAQNDQMFRVEKGAGLFIPLTQDAKVGLVQHAFRPQVIDLALHEQSYPYETREAIAELLENIGRPSWEFPRGYPQGSEGGVAAAVREGSEETVSAVVSMCFIGKNCGNTAWEPHFMTIVAGVVDPTKMGLPADPNEKMVRGLTFFTKEELNELIRDGDLYCNMTLAALRLLEAHGIDRVLEKLNA
jgi:hypothetical protein